MAKHLVTELIRVFEARQRQLFVAAVAVTRDRASAEDAVFDALLAISQLEHSPDDLAAYLFRTVRNKALHHVKRSSRFENEPDLAEFIDTSAQSPEQQVFSRQVLTLLEQLEPDQQQVLIMKLFGDLTFAEIAEITNSNSNTVASWYRRGLIALKERIDEPTFSAQRR